MNIVKSTIDPGDFVKQIITHDRRGAPRGNEVTAWTAEQHDGPGTSVRILRCRSGWCRQDGNPEHPLPASCDCTPDRRWHQGSGHWLADWSRWRDFHRNRSTEWVVGQTTSA